VSVYFVRKFREVLNVKTGSTNTNSISAIIAQTRPDNKILNYTANNRSSETDTSTLTEDTVVISTEGKAKSDSFQSKLEEMRNRYRMLREDLKRAEAAASGMAEQYKEKIRCMRIAMRIMSGGKVPIEDQRYLAERDMELYTQAMSMKLEKADPKEYDRLSEDEKSDSITDANDTSDSDTEPAEADAPAEVSPDST
jgi:hypothetical protein